MPVGIAQGYAFPADLYVQGDLPDLCGCLPSGHQGCRLEVWRIICHELGLVPILPIWKLPQVLHTPNGCGCWNVQGAWPCSRNLHSLIVRRVPLLSLLCWKLVQLVLLRNSHHAVLQPSARSSLHCWSSQSLHGSAGLHLRLVELKGRPER